MNRFLIVDGNSLANRAYYAMPYLSDKKGRPSGAVFGFFNILVKLITEQRPSHIAVAFDHSRKTFRNEIYNDYKATRHAMPDELREQMPVLKEMLSIMKIRTFEFQGIEADDIIGTLSKKLNDCHKILLSGDRDLLQLVDNTTEVWLTKKGVTDLKKVDEKVLKEDYGLEPYQVIELKALMGDTSDNIPGIKGVGEKTALSLLEKYQDLDNVYSHIEDISGKLKEKIETGRDSAYMSKQLATIKTDCDFEFHLEECSLNFPFNLQTYEFCLDRGFGSIVKRSELFESTKILENKSNRNRILIEELEVLKNLKENTKEYFAYNFDDFEFCADNGSIYYLNKEFDLFSNAIQLEEVLLYLKEIFEDRNILKITTSAKSDMKALKNVGVELNNFFDLSLANYVLTAGFTPSKEKIELEDYVRVMLNLKSEMEDKKVSYVYDEIEYPLVKVLFEMEESGFKIDRDNLEELSQKFEQEINELSCGIYEDAGEEFNINSPKQVANILYDKLGLKSNRKQSTDIAHLTEIMDDHPIVKKIIKFRKLSKLKNTYIDVYKEIVKNSGDIIHTVFNQSSVSTGRLSSSDPNLQNIPTRDEEGKALRKLFISKFENGMIVSADYNQIELRLLADMSDEENLICAYNNGDDIHALTASQIFGKNIDEITSNERREAKAVNFGIIYGISEYGLSQNIKTSVKKAKEYIESYFSRYPKVKEFMDENVKFAKENGYICTKFGRIRNIPEINSSVYITKTFGERVAMNSSLQGTASDIIKLAMIRIFERLKTLKSELILQIHDELIVDVYPGEEKQVCEILKTEMENIAKFKVPLPIGLGIGKNLYECK